MAGRFRLGQRVIDPPTKLLAYAASQAFVGETPSLGGGEAVRRPSLGSTAGFALMGLAGMASVPLLGETWREAETMAAPRVPQHLARFVVVPVSQILDIYGRQNLRLAAAAALVLVLAFGLARPFGLDPMRAILAHSIGTTLAYLLYLWFIRRVARRGGLTDGARQGRARTRPPRRRRAATASPLDA